jgi:UDP-N-acetylmuramoylalanine--D-glutamate ligase
MGRDASLIRTALGNKVVNLFDAQSMQDAVVLAAGQAQPGDAVLMSPACASFDMFDNYEHRARAFFEAVQALALDEGAML